MAGAQKNRQRKERKGGKSQTSEEKRQDPSSSSSGSGRSPKSGQNVSPPRMDGNRDPATGPASGSGRFYANKNIDVGGHLASLGNGMTIANLPKRSTVVNTTGKEIAVKLNNFAITAFPTKTVHQYDVTIGGGNEKRIVQQKVWNSKQMQDAIGVGCIYDGNKLAWSLRKLHNEPNEPFTIVVDLDKEEGKQSTNGKNSFKVVLRFTNHVQFSALEAYLDHRGDRVKEIYESISFLDHLLRQTPSTKLTAIKRNFFAKGQKRHNLGNGLEAFKGVYASITTTNQGNNKSAGLAVNVDVANSAFWTAQPLLSSMGQLTNAPGPQQLVSMLKPTQDGRDSRSFTDLKKMRRLGVTVKHLPGRSFTIDKFHKKTADEEKISMDDGRSITVRQHFANKNPPIHLQYPNLPLVQMTKMTRGTPNLFPPELCHITENQRYSFKLSDKQTSEMIKFAVTLPKERWAAVEHGLTLLNWQNDPFLQNYGLRISTQPTTVRARLLPNPKVQFAGTSPNALVNPGTTGRWDLRNKKFIEPHSAPLNSWGWAILPDRSGRPCVAENTVKQFIQMFVQTFGGHGGKVQNKQPFILANVTQGNPAAAVEALYNGTGRQAKANPQILFFILPDKDSVTYNRIKKSAECRYGLVSQCLQAAHVQRCQQQYASNVCMKVNAKLGGATAKAAGMRPQGWFSKPTMVIGIDVTHGPPAIPGMPPSPSIAAITMSWDRNALKYIAGVASNGIRQELVLKENISSLMLPMVDNWLKVVSGGKFPEHIIVVRDGIGEGQYSQVLETEIASMKEIFQTKASKSDYRMTVLVASKRHHVRFFPRNDCSDKNGNPQPGTLVETGCTLPFEYDFYLNSHSAIKGTARPVHYQVLLDEANMPVAELQNMLYEHSYQYIRSTTPVSLYPAVYYAHLAAGRATAHVDMPLVPSSGTDTKTGSSGKDAEAKPLIPLGGGVRGTMWYI